MDLNDRVCHYRGESSSLCPYEIRSKFIVKSVNVIGSWLVIKSVKVEKNASIVMFVTQSYHTNWGRQLLLGLTYWVRVRVRNQSISNQFFNLWCDVGISRLCILREKNDASHESFPLGLVPMSNSVVCQRVELGRTWANWRANGKKATLIAWEVIWLVRYVSIYTKKK